MRSSISRIARDRVALVLPLRAQTRQLLVQIGELTLHLLESVGGCLVLLLAQRSALDLELLHAPLHLVDLRRNGVDLHAQPRGRFVDEVDRLVGQEASGDVAVRKRRRRYESRVGDAHSVVHLIALLETAKDPDRVLDGRLVDEHRLEPSLEGRIALDVLAELVERRRTDRAELAAREHRLQHVRGVDGAFGGAGTHERVQLVDEHDDLAVGLGDLLQEGLHPLLELAAELGARDHPGQVERDHALVLQRFGNVAGRDALREALDDRGLAGARLPDEDGVVLRPS